MNASVFDSRLPLILATNGVDLSGLLGGTQKKTGGLGDGSPPAASRGGAPVGSLGDEVPQKLKVFVKLHLSLIHISEPTRPY